MDNVRLKLTENEKIANMATELNGKSFSMNEKDIDKIIDQEKKTKFNDELEKYVDEMKEYNESMKQLQDNIGKDPTKLEIKPLHEQIIIKPFEHNPFQKVEVKNGIITDTGGFKINIDMNPVTGKMEEQEQVILTGCVMEIGPEVKYVKPGDVVFYHRRNRIPIPFFKQGFYNLEERYILAVVNEWLSDRFQAIKNSTWINPFDLPEVLGSTVEERIKTQIKLKEQGICLEKIK